MTPLAQRTLRLLLTLLCWLAAAFVAPSAAEPTASAVPTFTTVAYTCDVPSDTSQARFVSGRASDLVRASSSAMPARSAGDLSALRALFVAAEAGAGADNAVNGVRLGQQLARESANSAFTASGELQSDVIAGSREIVPGSKLGNPDVVSELTSDGSKIGDWGKYSTQTIRGPSGDFQVHYYMNRVTGAVNYNYDYKIVFGGGG